MSRKFRVFLTGAEASIIIQSLHLLPSLPFLPRIKGRNAREDEYSSPELRVSFILKLIVKLLPSRLTSA